MYRYALERWEPECTTSRCSSGEIPAEAKQLILDLDRSSWSQEKHFNYSLNLADWDEAQGQDAARFGLRVPAGVPLGDGPACRPGHGAEVLLSGPLREEWIQAVIDSPARQAVARRLIGGESAVWLFLESGDREKDEKAYDVLSRQLDHLEKTLKLPDPNAPPLFTKDAADNETILVDDFSDVDTTGLRIDFSILRLSRDDPAEQMLIEILRREMDLMDYDSEPMAFPFSVKEESFTRWWGEDRTGNHPRGVRIPRGTLFLPGQGVESGDRSAHAADCHLAGDLAGQDKTIPLPFGFASLAARDSIRL